MELLWETLVTGGIVAFFWSRRNKYEYITTVDYGGSDSVFLDCDLSVAARYTSQTQRSRVLSEKWFQTNGFCLSCKNDQLLQTPTNTKASDFICESCNERYELKAFKVRPPRKLVNGAYSALMSRIFSGSVPTLMLLERNDRWQVQGLTAVHHMFLTPGIIEKRKPLSPTARRAGWVGCNIRLDLIASDALIRVVDHGRETDKESIRERFQKFNRLKAVPLNSRGWTTLTLRVARSLNRLEFTLEDIYRKEQLFFASYPENKNIRAKIRQQLQVLRDLGYIKFCGSGRYLLLI